MKLLDGHLHTRTAPGNWFRDCADERGYAAYAVLSLSCMASFHGAANNDYCLAAKKADPARCYFFAGLAHPCGDYRKHVQTWLERGADGIKFIETKPTVYKETGVDLSDERFDAMFGYLEETATPILWHVGDPATFWHREQAPDFAIENGWLYDDGSFPTLEALYAIPEKVLARHPKLHIAFAHLYFCGDDMQHARRLLDTYPNVRFDLTPGVEMYGHFFADRALWRAFFMDYQDRLQLGTDTDMGDKLSAPDALKLTLGSLTNAQVDLCGQKGQGLDLPEAVIEKIIYSNFRCFAGENPKSLP